MACSLGFEAVENSVLRISSDILRLVAGCESRNDSAAATATPVAAASLHAFAGKGGVSHV